MYLFADRILNLSPPRGFEPRPFAPYAIEFLFAVRILTGYDSKRASITLRRQNWLRVWESNPLSVAYETTMILRFTPPQ